MGVGAWSLRLSPNTPGDVLSKVSLKRHGFGHVVVTSARLDSSALSDADMLEHARFTGVYRKQPSEFEMAGVGVNAWLGDEDGKGIILGASTSAAGGTFANWVPLLRPTYLGTGTVSTIAGSFPNTYVQVTMRKALDEVCAFFGAEWRVGTDFKLHVGLPADLFRDTPIAVVTRRGGGRDLSAVGVMGEVEVVRDLEDWVRSVLYYYNSGAGVVTADGSVAAADVAYRGPTGLAADIRSVISSSVATVGEATPLAAAEFGKVRYPRQEIRLSSIEYDIGESVNVGDNLWVFDPERDMYDLANPVTFRGQTIFPEVIRCVGQTWPIRKGMGVYFRRFVDNNTSTWDVDWVDLTEFVEWESGDTTVEIGEKPRPSR